MLASPTDFVASMGVIARKKALARVFSGGVDGIRDLGCWVGGVAGGGVAGLGRGGGVEGEAGHGVGWIATGAMVDFRGLGHVN